MAVVQKFGKPDFFITMTCNPNWEEILRELHPGENSQDRPDITTRIFHSKCEALRNDLIKKGVLGKVVAHVQVIEFQKKRIAPCSHSVNEADKLHSPDDYDAVVQVEIPDQTLEPDLYRIVMKHMIHVWSMCSAR
ncbi:DNA helicase [Ranunculus cassubicifolius]